MTDVPIPPPHEPIVDEEKRLREVWYRYFNGAAIEAETSLGATFSALTTASTISSTADYVPFLQASSGEAKRILAGQFLVNPGTAIATTGASDWNFTGIPANVKRVTLSLDNVSLSSGGGLVIQLGTSAGIVNSGYSAVGTRDDSTVGTATVASTVGYRIVLAGGITTLAAINLNMQINRITSHTWVASFSGATLQSSGSHTHYGGGRVALGAELDRLTVTNTATANNVFTGGQANIHWEF